ncbi:MAG: hypothetical protein JOY59_11320 [Candidatus Eremiobacteraeota bacterium]|nr:hypothetical protein [Candidatus Eremiobacteraeota bacterium]
MQERSRAAYAVAAAAALLLVVSGAASAAALPAPKHKSEPIVRNLIVTVNGQQLEAEPAPRIEGGRVLVPMVRVLGALAITVTRDGSALIAQAPNKTIRLTLGSRTALVDNQPLTLDAPPVVLDGVTYVPLRLLSEALGASVTYDPGAERIDITSQLIGRESGAITAGGKTTVTGSLTALDVASQPASMTVTYRGSVRTISINSTAKVVVEDVVARTQQNGQLSDLHVGDAIAVTLSGDGRVQTIVDLFGSRSGTVAAVSPTAIVLENGRVITPDRTTEITLNGAPVALSDLAVGDAVTQRMNPETGETRQIMASRKLAAPVASGTPAPPSPASTTGALAVAGSVAITSFTISPARPLHLGETFDLTLRGTPGGRATYDIGNFLTKQPMREESPGVYKAGLRVDPGMNFTLTSVFGHLAVGEAEAKIEAPAQISVATIAPQISEVAPANGQVINNNRPSIYATFATPTDLGINPSSITIKVNGTDVTTSATRTGSFVTYTTSSALADGPVTVAVRIADLAGNEASRSWTFTIRTR